MFQAHGLAHARTAPFLPVLEHLRAYFGITEHDDHRAAREKVAGPVLLLEESLREALPLMFEFLGVSDPEHPAEQMYPEARQRRLLDIVRRLVHAHSRREDTLPRWRRSDRASVSAITPDIN